MSADGVQVVAYRPEWAAEAARLVDELRAAVPSALGVEHIGSTAIFGMDAKDCLDLMILVDDLETSRAEPSLSALGYRRRPEPWNNAEPAIGRDWPKMVFAPPAGARATNIHVRVAGSPTARIALLFRDHLRANPARVRWWSDLKSAATEATTDLAGYGRIKHPAWLILMDLAEAWATETGWQPAGLEPEPTVIDDQGRPEAPVASDEVSTIIGFLEFHRATFAWKCAGLGAAGLSATTGSSTMTLGGMLKHLAYVEDHWFSHRMHGNERQPIWRDVSWETDPEWDWHSAAEDSPTTLSELWQDATARSRDLLTDTLSAGGLDQLARRSLPDGRTPSVRWIVLHMIEEYARHNGHADLIREAVDGLTGE